MLSQTNTKKLARGCGYRKWGATYMVNYKVNQTDEVYQFPCEHFLFCPPWEINPAELGLCSQGLRIIERPGWNGGTGIYDIYDWVGAEPYPFATDFIEETKRIGTSRLITRAMLKSEEFKLLDPAVSQHFFISPTALLTDESAAILVEHNLNLRTCPLEMGLHVDMIPDTAYPCLALNWEAVSTVKTAERKWYVPVPREEYPTFAYEAAAALSKWKIEFKPAVFMALPLSGMQLDVIEDPIEHTEEDALKLLADLESQFPYYMATD